MRSSRWESNGVEPAAHLDTTADQVVDADDVDFIFALLESKWLAGQDISDPAGTTTSAEPNGSASTVGEGSGSDTRDGSTAETESLTLVSDEMTTGSGGGFAVSSLSSSSSASASCSGSPPALVDDNAYTTAGQSIAVESLWNDPGVTAPSIIITSVTQPSQGGASTDGDRVFYTPNSTVTGTGDSFQYTVQDGCQFATATVYITWVNVTGYTVERKLPEGTYIAVPDSELSWSHDELRWTETHSPAPPSLEVLDSYWYADDRTDSVENWMWFAGDEGSGSATGNPGPGFWQIYPEVIFTQNIQTAFVVSFAAPKQKDVAEITSISWATHINADGSASVEAGELVDDADGGKRVYPDAVNPGEAARDKVDVIVQIAPAMAGVQLASDWFDVDDPSDDDGPIDNDGDAGRNNVADNAGTTGRGGASLATAITDINGRARWTFTIGGIQPGNNFRVAAAPRQAAMSPLRALDADTESRMFYDTDGDGMPDISPGILDESSFHRGIRITSRLTVWRYLRVEVDSMGDVTEPDPNDDQGDAHSPLTGDVPDPDIAGLAEAFHPLYIDIKPLSDATISQNDTDPYWYFSSNTTMDCYFLGGTTCSTYPDGYRDTKNDESVPYWVVHIAGIYDNATDGGAKDNDYNDELGVTGYSDSTGAGYAVIYMEVLHDVADDWGWTESERAHAEQVVVTHEIGHQFGLGHSGDITNAQLRNVMSVPSLDLNAPRPDVQENYIPDMPLSFSESDRKKIRTIIYP